MKRVLRFVGFLVINVVIAVIGTAVADTELRRLIPPYSITAVVWKETVLSILLVAFIGSGAPICSSILCAIWLLLITFEKLTA